jgi:hypothetical protein
MLVVLLLSGWPLMAQKKNQSQSEINIRGFLYSEEATPEAPAPRPKVGKPKKPKKTTAPKPSRRPKNVAPVALGYTIFMDQPGSEPIRVDPERTFHTNDCIRMLLEPGIDGYLYIIHRENDGSPKLLFPDPRLSQSNQVSAHKAVTIPSDNCWQFLAPKQNQKRSQVVEQLTVVLSREELDSDADVVLGGLAGLSSKLDVRTDARYDEGERITDREKKALQTRDLDLKYPGTPQATVVVANFGLAPMTVARINLLHKTR